MKSIGPLFYQVQRLQIWLTPGSSPVRASMNRNGRREGPDTLEYSLTFNEGKTVEKGVWKDMLRVESAAQFN